MNVQHINIKLFIENPQSVNLAAYSPVFNTWIQNHTLDELLIDVADYLHVPNGIIARKNEIWRPIILRPISWAAFLVI